MKNDELIFETRELFRKWLESEGKIIDRLNKNLKTNVTPRL